jgi:hypothetical protein
MRVLREHWTRDLCLQTSNEAGEEQRAAEDDRIEEPLSRGEVAEIEEAFAKDNRALHKIKILKSILQELKYGVAIVNRILCYFAKTSLLEWQPLRTLPPPR